MLSAQVEYWKLQETGRHNIVAESQGWANLKLGYANLEESGRHNRAQEALGFGSLAETVRHNTEQEATNWFNVHETQRHNVAQEQLGWGNLSELSRSNRVNESIGWANARTNRQNADTNYSKYQLDQTLGFMTQDIQDRLASVQEHNAETNSRNAELRAQELEWQKANDKARLGLDWWNAYATNANNTMRTYTTLGGDALKSGLFASFF